MHFLKKFYKKTLKYELLNKFIYSNTKKLPKLKKIVLNFGCKTTDIKSIASSLLALELIAFQKSNFTTAKNSNLVLKLRKGDPVGCKIDLRHQKMYCFLEKSLTDIFPKIKNFKGLVIKTNSQKNSFSYKLSDIFVFKTIEEHYYLFNVLPALDITIITTTKEIKELIFLIKFLQIPIKTNNCIYNSIGRV